MIFNWWAAWVAQSVASKSTELQSKSYEFLSSSDGVCPSYEALQSLLLQISFVHHGINNGALNQLLRGNIFIILWFLKIHLFLLKK